VEGNATLFPLAVPEKVILLTQPAIPIEPVVLTVLPLDVKENVALPPQLDVPFQVPANCAPALPLLLDFVQDDIVINENDASAAIASNFPLKIVGLFIRLFLSSTLIYIF